MSLARCAFLFCPLLAAGCADFSYQHLQLGQTREKYDGALPAASSRRTDLGLCLFSKDRFGRTDAIVLLLSEDRRIAAKIQAVALHHDYGFKVDSGYRMSGELDPRLYNTQQTGPIDTLRAVLIALTDYHGEKLAMEAHGFIAGGLVRLLQRWPGMPEIGIASERQRELVELAPAGGTARIAIDEKGVLRFDYEQGQTR